MDCSENPTPRILGDVPALVVELGEGVFDDFSSIKYISRDEIRIVLADAVDGESDHLVLGMFVEVLETSPNVFFMAASDGGMAALAQLRSRRLVRAAVSGDHLEAYHDRVRETVARHVDPGRLRECHAALAAALESSGRADPEAMASHLHAAGDLARAGPYAARAAR